MLVVPSLDEGFGMPVVEAMTIGVPVVAANRGALPEVSGDAAQLVDPLDDEEMAEAMRRILEEPAAAQAAVERGYRRARRYSWRTSAETLLQAYRQVHGRRRTRA
jgi:glycosyltransferase involved in cell wall biosynthesis